jgi:Flp pilus assembly protein TadD
MCARGSIGKLNRRGMEACRQGRLEEAEITLMFALMEARKQNARCFEAKVHNNLGIVYELRGSFAKAKHAYGEALKIYEAKVGTSHPASIRMARSLDRLSGTRPMHSVAHA